MHPRIHTSPLIAALVVVLATSSLAQAETLVELKNGAKFVVESLHYDGNEAVLVLAGGEIRVDRDRVLRESEATETPADRKVEDRSKVTTTHAISLHNGRILRGTLVEESEDEVVLGIPTVGQLTIARADIAELKEERSEIDVSVEPTPPAPESTDDDERPSSTTGTPSSKARLLIEEVPVATLVDLILEIDDDRIKDLPKRDRAAALEKLETNAYEVTRQRTINRTRGEAKLRSLGAIAVPRLEGLRDHPFDLVRRAVQRLVRDAGSIAGTPIAIDRLQDSDFWTRELAREAIRATVGHRVKLSAKIEPPSARIDRAVEAAWNAWYDAVEKKLDSAGIDLEERLEITAVEAAIGAKERR